MSNQVPQDIVTVTVAVEKYVTADTVRIEITAVAIVPDDATDIKSKIQGALNQAAPGAEWSFTGMDRETNSAGQEQVTAVASARIPDRELNGLANRLRDASKPGLKLTHSNTDYSPRQEQITDAVKELRSEIYKRAVGEAKILNEAIQGDYPWRVGNISFQVDDGNISNSRAPRGMKSFALAAASDMGGGGPEDEDMNLTRKVSLYASVNLSRKVYETI